MNTLSIVNVFLSHLRSFYNFSSDEEKDERNESFLWNKKNFPNILIIKLCKVKLFSRFFQ